MARRERKIPEIPACVRKLFDSTVEHQPSLCLQREEGKIKRKREEQKKRKNTVPLFYVLLRDTLTSSLQ